VVDYARPKATPARILGIAVGTSPQGSAFGEQFGSGRAMDRAVDTAAAQEARVGGIDDRIDGERRNVGTKSGDIRMHGVIFALRQAGSG
jgi:hypothetical protein